jgi:ribosomal 50S subunit-recycling heat shock protein
LRLDKFLKAVQLIKRRSVANEAAGEGIILVNGSAARPSKEIKAGDTIVIDMWNYRKTVRVNEVPEKCCFLCKLFLKTPRKNKALALNGICLHF